jgi:Ca2+-binding EF-hand superfamily protein
MLRFAIAAAAVVLLSMPVVSPARADSATNFIAKWDPDHDGTLDMAEINKAADALFDKLDVDHDGTLDMRELAGRVTKSEFDAADKDHDGTLDKSEYESIVAQRFHVANRDNDTTIEANELRTRAGKALLKLLD